MGNEIGALKTKPAKEPVPPELVTATEPEAPPAITAVIEVGLTTVNDAAAVPPKVTALTSKKFVPVMVTVTPPPEDVGVKEEIVGVGGMYVNPALVPTPSGLVTATIPLFPASTTAVIVVEFTTANEAAASPPKLTAVAVVKLVPVMVIVAPEAPLVGVNDVMVGAVKGAINVKPGEVVNDTGVVTFTAPDAPAPMVAVI